MVEKADTVQVRFTLESGGLLGFKEFISDEKFMWIPTWQTMSIIQLVQVLDENQGFSHIHGHRPWHVCEVALTLHLNILQRRLPLVHLTISMETTISYC